jgi:hypothetical protein
MRTPQPGGVRARRPGYPAEMDSWAPVLTLRERDGRCRLALSGLTHGEGRTLQEAADELVARVLVVAVAVSRGGFPFSTELRPPDRDVMAFLHDVAGLAGEQDELRRYVLRGR